jgi:hypothetical protein
MTSIDIRALEKDFAVEAGVVLIPFDRFASWQASFRACPDADREDRAIEVLAVAIKFHQAIGDAASFLLVQLCDLAGVLLKSMKVAECMAVDAGIDLARAARIVGVSRALPPRDVADSAGARSAVALRADAARKSRKK